MPWYEPRTSRLLQVFTSDQSDSAAISHYQADIFVKLDFRVRKPATLTTPPSRGRPSSSSSTTIFERSVSLCGSSFNRSFVEIHLLSTQFSSFAFRPYIRTSITVAFNFHTTSRSNFVAIKFLSVRSMDENKTYRITLCFIKKVQYRC